jgi:hypothetical protein
MRGKAPTPKPTADERRPRSSRPSRLTSWAKAHPLKHPLTYTGTMWKATVLAQSRWRQLLHYHHPSSQGKPSMMQAPATSPTVGLSLSGCTAPKAIFGSSHWRKEGDVFWPVLVALLPACGWTPLHARIISHHSLLFRVGGQGMDID